MHLKELINKNSQVINNFKQVIQAELCLTDVISGSFLRIGNMHRS